MITKYLDPSMMADKIGKMVAGEKEEVKDPKIDAFLAKYEQVESKLKSLKGDTGLKSKASLAKLNLDDDALNRVIEEMSKKGL
jgi:hypothetical protein